MGKPCPPQLPGTARCLCIKVQHFPRAHGRASWRRLRRLFHRWQGGWGAAACNGGAPQREDPKAGRMAARLKHVFAPKWSTNTCGYAWIHHKSTWTLPSGKHTKNYVKSPFLMDKSTINEPFSIANC